MKVVVAYQWAPDPKEAQVGADGSVDFSRAKPMISEYDAVAIELAREVAAAAGASLVGLCVGGPAIAQPVATKAALARGLDEVVVVADPSLEHAGTAQTAQLIAAAVAQIGEVGLVITGDSSIDSGSRMLAPTLAGFLGWAGVTDAMSVVPAGAAFAVKRALAEGVQELSVAGPAVIAATSDATKPKAPGMKDVMAAGKKPVTTIALPDLGVTLISAGTRRSASKAAVPARENIRIDTADPAAAGRELVAALAGAGVLG